MPAEFAPWVDGLTIGRMLRESARRFPDRDALVFPSLDAAGRERPAATPQAAFRRTFAEFDSEVDRVARALLALGVGKGEHVAVWATNWPQWVFLQFATARVGAVMVTVNPAYRSSELAYVLRQSDATVLFLVDRFRKSDYFAILAEAAPEIEKVAASLRDAGVAAKASAESPRKPPPPAPPSEGGEPEEPLAPGFAGERGRGEGVPRAANAESPMKPTPSAPPSEGGEPDVRAAHAAGTLPPPLSLRGFPKLRHVISMKDVAAPGMATWPGFLALADGVPNLALVEREERLSPHDPINIQYTSGTTGFPKGAMLTHRNLLLNAWCIADCQQFTERDRVCVPVPFYHCFGCVLGVLCCAVSGSALVVPAEYFDPLATLDAIEQERATAIYGVPTMFLAQFEHPTFAGRDLSSLRTGIMAGSPCPVELMKRVVGEMHCPEITIAYGLTEASPVITQTRTEDPLDLRVQTVGRLIPGVEVKLIDPSTGEELGDDRQGELCTRGHGVMTGYYNMPEATAAAIDADGWLHTGDLALRLPNGYYRITGRIKDMICRGGENIYPREIEEFLYTHPAIQDVAVVGVPDRRFVEEVCAWVRLKPGASLSEDELRQFCRANMAHYKVPRYVRFVTEFPQTVTGKIQKFRIRERMIDELGLAVEETA